MGSAPLLQALADRGANLLDVSLGPGLGGAAVEAIEEKGLELLVRGSLPVFADQVAEATALNREHLYRILSERGDPALRSLEAVLDALGFRLAVELKESA